MRTLIRFGLLYVAIPLIYVAAGVCLLSVGWAAKSMVLTAPWWVSAGVIASWVVIILGLASLYDSLPKQTVLQEHDQ